MALVWDYFRGGIVTQCPSLDMVILLVNECALKIVGFEL